MRARQEKGLPGVVSWYSVAARGVGGPLVWYGGGRFGRDLRLPALRTRWGQTEQQRKAAAAAWFSETAQRRKAEPRNLAGAAEALRRAGDRLQKTPPEDRFSWYVAAADSAGVLAAAASTTSDDRLRRNLIKACQAINRAAPTKTSLGVDVAPGDAARLRLVDAVEQRAGRSADTHSACPPTAWQDAAVGPNVRSAEVSALLGGASRVLMAARLAAVPDHVRVQAFVIQAIEVAAQITRTIAAQGDATAAQRRAAEATIANAPKANDTARPCSPSPGAASTSSGPCSVLSAGRGFRVRTGGPSAGLGLDLASQGVGDVLTATIFSSWA